MAEPEAPNVIRRPTLPHSSTPSCRAKSALPDGVHVVEGVAVPSWIHHTGTLLAAFGTYRAWAAQVHGMRSVMGKVTELVAGIYLRYLG